MLLEKNISQTLFFNDSFFLDTTLENISLIDSLEVIEVTKAAEKIKWINRFLKSYSGNINKKLNFEMIDKTRTFVATFQGKELGYTRVIDMTELFFDFYGKPVSRIAETYVKPTYRGQGVCTALRRYVRKNEHAQAMRIETYRFINNKKYFENEGFFYGYSISESMCIICTSEFIESLHAYNKALS